MKAFEEYVNGKMDKVEGWCGSRESVLFNRELEQMRRHFGAPALGVMEIGVHHGKYLIALHNLVGGKKKSLGIDLFDDQEKNIDKSGCGNLEQCKKNIKKYCVHPEKVELMAADSLDLDEDSVSEIRRRFGKFAYVSVDGGHEPNHVVNDLNLAIRLADSTGFIILDDYYNHLFPGVSEGFSRWIQDYPKFVPFAMTMKKLYLAHVSFHDRYLRFIAEKVQREKYKVVKHFGYACLGFRF